MSHIEEPYPELDITLIKLELELRLDAKLRDEEWEDLINDHYIQKLLDDTISSSEVADRVRQRRQIYGQRQTNQDSAARKLSSEDKESGSVSVLARLVAEEAAQDMEVQAFRTKVLGGQCLPSQEVSDWLKTRSIEDGPATWWLMDMPIPPDQIDHAITPGTSSEGHPLYKIEVSISPPTLKNYLAFRFLFYRLPGSEDIIEIPTAMNGILEALRQLSKRLAKEYAWTEADATHFVLTNHPPKIRPLTSTSQSRQLPALSRITLTIDPALSPQEVAEQYRQIRQEIMPSRHRDLSEKHLQLAFFSGTQMRLGTWQQKMLEWNNLHPAWAYKEASNFAHDSLQARRRVLRSN